MVHASSAKATARDPTGAGLPTGSSPSDPWSPARAPGCSHTPSATDAFPGFRPTLV